MNEKFLVLEVQWLCFHGLMKLFLSPIKIFSAIIVFVKELWIKFHLSFRENGLEFWL